MRDRSCIYRSRKHRGPIRQEESGRFTARIVAFQRKAGINTNGLGAIAFVILHGLELVRMADNPRYAIWNNKGGVGKTFVAFVVAAEYARAHPERRIIVLDLCPQANISEILLGGNKKALMLSKSY